jgi:hypothetical protein
MKRYFSAKQPSLYSMGNGTFPHQQSGKSARLTTTIYLVQILRMNGVHTSKTSNNFMMYARKNKCVYF